MFRVFLSLFQPFDNGFLSTGDELIMQMREIKIVSTGHHLHTDCFATIRLIRI